VVRPSTESDWIRDDEIGDGLIDWKNLSVQVRHVGNATVKVDSRGTRITKEHKHNMGRIHLTVATVIAQDIAATVETGPQP